MFQYDIKKQVIDYKLANLDQLEADFKHTYNYIEINKEKLIEYRILTKKRTLRKNTTIRRLKPIVFILARLLRSTKQQNKLIRIHKSLKPIL